MSQRVKAVLVAEGDLHNIKRVVLMLWLIEVHQLVPYFGSIWPTMPPFSKRDLSVSTHQIH